jgi:hypothetical protein
LPHVPVSSHQRLAAPSPAFFDDGRHKLIDWNRIVCADPASIKKTSTSLLANQPDEEHLLIRPIDMQRQTSC